MITEVKEYKVSMKRPSIICDRVISEQIQPPLPRVNHTMLILGAPGSGKTTFSMSLLLKGGSYHKVYNKVFLIIPPSSLSSLNVPLLRNHKNTYDELSKEALDEIEDIVDKGLEKHGKDHHSLIVYDDVGATIKSDHKLEEELKKFCYNFRHRCRSQWFLLQTYRSLTLSCRKCATHLMIFKLNQLELETIGKEVIMWVNLKTFLEVCRHVFDANKYNKHTALFVDLDNQKFYRFTDKTFYELEIET